MKHFENNNFIAIQDYFTQYYFKNTGYKNLTIITSYQYYYNYLGYKKYYGSKITIITIFYSAYAGNSNYYPKF